ncbi:trithorax group protein osa-like isoform X2 [Homarus americanus]|uniref:trithorax group protein osa-like isoform X2 n=1 Tax=Homarus americanus TaxID=6706 RepID=UPI001C45827F|nr:trithorax group protein osa-like isoform X2 [Homarus americanus]
MSVLELRLQIYTISLLEHSDISHQVTAFYLNVSFQMRLLAVYLPFSLVVVVVTISVSDSDERHTELTSRSGFISDKDLSQRTLRHVGSTFNDIQEGSPATTPSTTTTTQPQDTTHHPPSFSTPDPSQPGGPRRQSLRFQQQLHQHQQQHEEQELRRQLKEQLREQLEQQPREQFTPPTHPDISLIPLQAVEEDNGGNGVMGEKFPPYTEVFPPFPPHALPASTPSPVPQAPPKRHISQAIQAPSRPQVFQSQQGTQRPQIPQPQQVFQQPLNSHLFKVQQDTQSFQNPQISQAPPNHRLQVSQHPQSVQHPPSPQILQAPQRLQAPPKSQISQAPRDPQALRLLGEFRPPQALSDAPQEFQTAQAPQAVLAHHISPPLLSLQAPQTPQALQVIPAPKIPPLFFGSQGAHSVQVTHIHPAPQVNHITQVTKVLKPFSGSQGEIHITPATKVSQSVFESQVSQLAPIQQIVHLAPSLQVFQNVQEPQVPQTITSAHAQQSVPGIQVPQIASLQRVQQGAPELEVLQLSPAPQTPQIIPPAQIQQIVTPTQIQPIAAPTPIQQIATDQHVPQTFPTKEVFQVFHEAQIFPVTPAPHVPQTASVLHVTEISPALQVSPGVQEAQVPDNTQVTPRPRLPVDFNEPNLPTGGPEVKFPTGAHGPRFPTGPHGPRFPTGPHTSRIPQGHRAPPRRPHPGGGPPQRVTGRRPPQRPLAPPVRDLTHPERPRPTPPRPGLRQARGRANLLPNRPSSSHTRVHSSPLSTGDVLTHRMDKGHMEVKSNVSTPNKNEIQVGAHDISFPSTYSIPDLNANIPERSDSLKVSLGNKNNIQKDPTRRLQQGGMKGRRPGVVEVLRKKLPQSLNLSETGHTVQKRLRKLVGSAATRASLMGKVTGEVLGAGVVAVGHAKDALIQAMSKPVGSPRAYETHTYASGLQLTVPHEDHVKHHRFGVRFNWSSTPPGGLLPVVGMGIDSNVMTKSLPSGSYVPPALLGPYTHSDSYHFNPLTYNNHPPNYHGSPPFHQGGPPHPPIHHGGPHLPPNYHGSPPFHQRGPPHPPIHHGGPPLPPNHQGSPFHQGGPPHPPIHHGGPPLPPNHQGSPFHQGGPPHHGGLLHPPIHQGGPPYPPIHEGNRRHPPVHHGGRLHSSFHQGRPANLPIINKDHLPNVNNGRLESTDHGDNSFTDNPYFTSHQEEDLEYLPDLGHDYPGKTGQFHRSSSNRPCWNGRWVRPPVTQVFQYGPHSYPPCAPRTHIPPHHRPRLSHNRNNPHHHQNNNKHNNQFQNNTHNTLNQDYPKQVKDIKDIIKYPSHPRDQRSKDDPKNESVFLNLRPDGIDIEAELNPYRSMDELRRAISQKEEEFTILDIISRENQELYFDQVIITGGDEEHKF